ncbi:LysR family transcriptional regulator [Geodermatophilus sabuli]|uniref:DNA-binding transcriptional regulator, LysR family n=1 Tax=Geodermatophilus sabuli TaxID=1564158 RepID=A0A285EB83_9ACTN|nr:LysR family transcriptional regulator [Geodermatophilus sabuli]MBB3084343.1 DNA-binding transcriptional LysR family regulator [Geodermatophilus sabuli]SNX96388.1 DNA-binding transcriptional regulator, LysR family [Geodermatophilus sabuli]
MTDADPAATDAELSRLASVDLNLLVPLLAVLEDRSVTRAAARVGLTQPAMSHALRRLRRLLGDELIVRQGNTMTLTPRAAELIAPLRRALRQTARVVDFPAFDPAADSRVITVGMTTSTALVIGDAVARLLGERAPHVTLRLLAERTVSESLFTDEGVDVLLLSFASRYPRERLYDDRWVVITGPATPEDASALDLLTTLPHVVFDGVPRFPVPYAVLDERGIPYRVRDRVTDYLLIPHLVAGSGAVAVHRHRVTTALQPLLGLRIEEFPFPMPGLGIDMVWNPWLVDVGFTTWLRGVFLEAAAQLPPGGR